MSLTFPVEILASVLAIVAGLAGYAFREYRNRAEPFFVLSEIRGRMRRGKDVPVVPATIRDQISRALYINDITERSNMDAVYTTWDMADDVKQVWPKMRSLVDQVLEADRESELTIALKGLLKMKFFSSFIQTLVLRSAILVPDEVGPDVGKLRFYEDPKELNGCVWFEFPGDTIQVGSNLGHPAVKGKMMPFFLVLSTLNVEVIHEVFTQFRAIMETEHSIALSVHEDLKKVLDGRSHWVFIAYFANLSGNPIVLQQAGKFHVRDITGVSYTEDCKMILIERDQAGEARHQDTRRPLVVKPASDSEVGFVTSRVQDEMKFGRALREVFERGEATVTIEVSVEKVGFYKRQNMFSRKAVFTTTDSN